MKETFLNKIVELHQLHRDFKKLIEQKQKEITESKDKLLSNDNVPGAEELEKLYTDYHVDLVLFSADLQLISARLGFYIELYTELLGELPEEVLEFYNEHKKNFPKRSFVIVDGKVQESEDGVLEIKRKQFLQSDFYKSLQKMLD